MVEKSKSKKALSGFRQEHIRVKRTKNRKASSQQWLERHINDPYVSAAKSEGYRARSAFKLLQLDEKNRIFRPGMKVVDLGAAPGGWCQVAREKIGAKGTVLALDILEMKPLPGVTFLQGDFTEQDVADKLLGMVDGKVDVVLSDMAANTTGHTKTDHIRIMELARMAHEFAQATLKPGGTFVCKLFHGGAEKSLQDQLKRDFATVKYAKPDASRKESAETYLVAKGFRAQVR